jgi:perosamine synthetase
MKRLDAILMRREQVVRIYHQHLSAITGLILPSPDVSGVRISWFVYVVRLSETYTVNQRDAIVQNLREAGVGCGRYFAPIHLQPSYSAWKSASLLPVTESQAQRTIALPFFNRITDVEISQVCSALIAAMNRFHSDNSESQ